MSTKHYCMYMPGLLWRTCTC